MTQTEGEKEIVLGNKQLVSLFFVVVALLGVFFAAGYMIGRKSVSPLPITAGTPAADASGSSRQPDSELPRDAAPRDTSPASNAEAQPAEPAPDQVQTLPEPDKPRAREPKPVHTAKVEREDDVAISKPESGATYLQVTALRHPEADNLVRSLREQNFPASLAPSSVDTLFRVLVGPYHETSRVADAKAKLKALGFGKAFVQK